MKKETPLSELRHTIAILFSDTLTVEREGRARSAGAMSRAGEELLIIYESEAEQWATYLKQAFTGAVPEAGIFCCDIAAASGHRHDLPRLARYGCKLLILSKGMLDGLGQEWRSFLARVLQPAAQVVVLLCGVESLSPLLELVPLDGHECLQISSEQDAHEYLDAVTDRVKRGASAVKVQPSSSKPTGPEQTLVVPSRVPSGSSADVFVLSKDQAFGGDTEVEFAGGGQTRRVRPVLWNERILCVAAPGDVRVTVFCDGAPLSKAQLQYYSSTEEMARLLSRAADPVDFMCQALQVSSLEQLDEKLSSMMLKAMPAGGFPELERENTPDKEIHQSDVPSLLHFAARYGLKSTAEMLLRCPGAGRALGTADRRGLTPADVAQRGGHAELQALLTEKLNAPGPGEDGGDVYEVMCATGSPSAADVPRERRGEEEKEEEEEEEDIYAPLGVDDEYDTIVNPTTALVIANRPPAPTPRPESTWEDRHSYITQVFLKKRIMQGKTDLYSLPTRQPRGREHGGAPSSASVPEQINGPQQQQQRLDELQQRVKARSPAVDQALERCGDWHGARKGMDDTQKKKLSQQRATFISAQDNGNSVYDKINNSPQAPGVTVTEGRRGSQQQDFYCKPLKGPQGAAKQ